MANEDITFILKARNEARRATKEVQKQLDDVGTSVDEVAQNSEKAAQASGELAKEANRAARAVGGLVKGLGALAGLLLTSLGPVLAAGFFQAFAAVRIIAIAKAVVLLVGVLGGLFVINQLAQAAAKFNAALAETSTLIEGTPQQIAFLREETTRLVRAYGGSSTQQIAGFYQAISAGATDLAAATAILEQANKLAVGGVTDVKTSVDILTTAINAYGEDVLSASEASDSLFVAVRAGKTTVDELASTLGRVIPLASNAGVTFDELNAAVAALTTQGINTAEAVTGIRAVLTEVVRAGADEGSRAAKVARELGIEFNVAALQAQGFETFITNVIEKTGGSTELLSQLFGSVEAAGTALAFAGGAGIKFSQILEDQAEKAGATEEAYRKVADSLSQRLADAQSRITLAFNQLGRVVLPAVTLALEALAGVLTLVVDNADLLIIGLGLLATAKFPALLAIVVRVTGAIRAYVAAITAANFATFALGSGGLRAMGAQIAANAADFRKGADAARNATKSLSLYERATNLVKNAVGFLRVALKAVPFVGTALLLGGVIRAYKESKKEAEEFAAAVKRGEDALVSLEGAVRQFRNDVTERTTAELRKASTSVINDLQAAIDAQEQIVARAQQSLSPFSDRSGLQDANDKLRELRNELALARAALNDANRAEMDFATGVATSTEAIARQAQVTREATELKRQEVPTIEELRAKYGELAEVVRQNIIAQNELADVNTEIKFGNALAEASKLLGTTGRTREEIDQLNNALIAIRNLDTFGDQAREAANLADEIVAAAGGVDQLTDNERRAVELLREAVGQAASLTSNANGAAGAIGNAAGQASALAANLNAAANALLALQGATANLGIRTAGERAFNEAIASGQDRIGASAARDKAVARLEAGDALGSQDRIVRIQAQRDLESYNKTVDENVRVQREQVQLLEQYRDSLSGSSGGGGGGGGGGAIGATSQLDQTIQQLTQTWRENAATAGLAGEALEQYRIRQQLLNAAQQDGVALTESTVQSVLAQREQFKQAEESALTFAAGAKAGLVDFKDSVQTNFEFAREFTQNAFGGIANSLAEFIKTGKLSFRDLIADLLAQIAQFLANRLVTQFLEAASGGGGLGGGAGGAGGGGGGGFLGFLGGLLGGGGKALGGPVSPSTGYLVGERGPELFRPQMPGEIIPARETARLVGQQGAAPIINFTVNTPDADSFRRSQPQIMADLQRRLQREGGRGN